MQKLYVDTSKTVTYQVLNPAMCAVLENNVITRLACKGDEAGRLYLGYSGLPLLDAGRFFTDRTRLRATNTPNS